MHLSPIIFFQDTTSKFLLLASYHFDNIHNTNLWHGLSGEIRDNLICFGGIPYLLRKKIKPGENPGFILERNV